MNEITLNVRRSTAAGTGETYQTYALPIPATSLLMALRYIKDNMDPTLDFRAYHCAKGACNSCIMMLDEKIIRACEAMVEPGKTYKVSPPKDGYDPNDLFAYETERSLFE